MNKSIHLKNKSTTNPNKSELQLNLLITVLNHHLADENFMFLSSLNSKYFRTPSEKYAFFTKSTQILLKIRKIYAKTQNLQKIRKIRKFYTQKMKNLAWITQILRKFYAEFTQITQNFFAFVHQNFEWSTPQL